MNLTITYSDAQLRTILEQSVIYTCACPAQVCKQLTSMRSLFSYQTACLNQTDTDRVVHTRIAEAVALTHAEMERCLDDVLRAEGWDMATLTMPVSLQKRIADTIAGLDCGTEIK